MSEQRPLIILGCGYTGAEAARQALAAGRRVVGTTRSPERASELSRVGVEARVVERLEDEVAHLVPEGADVLVTFPPDGRTDVAIAKALGRARAIAYISSTGVYGDASGHIDEDTPVDGRDAKAAARLGAEEAYRAAGGIVLRAAAIYGPGRGLHVRLAKGEHKVAGGGRNVVSRIHVEDLARLALAALEKAEAGSTFVVADDAPVPQAEVIGWLCARMGVEAPKEVPREALPPTLQHDRAVDGRRIQRALGVGLRYPTYREGFGACLDGGEI
ncbi:NAD-dependent epimerase/dehydratase family protein [Polyangium aurulentum]|uniref:NAD-dependent epimerase/dehydratase family protein n=1 Tax=Polyangium aurulentum TaxID=2567896 RepID=UPI0010AE86DA|nr:NAD-dependent epimerase/dehydratase family protein [Polyangium aurulentum]UQA62520.1 NAD-dependent epimerase/dehydratase family protein [Polyangium aurulentum]